MKFLTPINLKELNTDAVEKSEQNSYMSNDAQTYQFSCIYAATISSVVSAKIEWYCSDIHFSIPILCLQSEETSSQLYSKDHRIRQNMYMSPLRKATHIPSYIFSIR